MVSTLLAARSRSIATRCASPRRCSAAEKSCSRFDTAEGDANAGVDAQKQGTHVMACLTVRERVTTFDAGTPIAAKVWREGVIASMQLTVTGKQIDTGDAV